MSFTSTFFTARAAAFTGMGVMKLAFSRAHGEALALGARMITTMTTAAT
jgi:hypothetical protein